MRASTGATLLLALVAGCDAGSARPDAGTGDGQGTCAEPIPRPVLGACVASAQLRELTTGSGARALALDLAGQVTALGEGAPDAPCFFEHQRTIGQAFSSDSPELDRARWLRVSSDDASEALIGVVAEGFELDVGEGDAVRLSFLHEPGDFDPSNSRLELRAGDDGRLLLWLGFAGATEDLTAPPEVSPSQGEVECLLHDECVESWTQHALDVIVDGAAATLEYGEQREVGDFVVTHGGVDTQAGPSRCPDAFVAWAAAAVWGG